MAFRAQHPAVVDFLDLMSIVPDLRLEQIVVQPGSITGWHHPGHPAGHRRIDRLARPRRRLAADDRVVVFGSLPSLNAMGR
jgi:hypothetical protein